MIKDIVKDIIDWDIINWGKSLDFWSDKTDIKEKDYTCLELGANKGGLSLWLAMNGNNVICSDINSPEDRCNAVHKKYPCHDKINYEAINALEISYKNKFDIVIFKSILGGISRNGNDHLQKRVIDEIYQCLKTDGILLFAENLEGSFLHKFMRKRFVRWGKEWNYLKYNEARQLFSSFNNFHFITVGFFGAFGRTEKQRQFLGKIDSVIESIIPKSKRYIIIGMAKK